MNHEPLQPDDETAADEARLAALLRAVAADAPAADAAALATLREKSQKMFADQADIAAAAAKTFVENKIGPTAAANQLPAANDPPTVAVHQSTHLSSQSHALAERSPSPSAWQSKANLRLSWRGLAAVAALAMVVVLGLAIAQYNTAHAAPQFSQVLDQLGSAKTLQFKMSRAGQSADVLVHAPDTVRIDDAPNCYRIAAGSRQWQIDVAKNTVTAIDSPGYFHPAQPIDLLSLLQLGIADPSPLLNSRPAQQADYQGRRCSVYVADLSAQPAAIYQQNPQLDLRHLQITAYADAQTNQLRGLVVRPVAVPGVDGPSLAELQVLAMNAPIDEAKFVVAKSLTDDGHLAIVADAQGLVTLRPALADRWTPIGPGDRLHPRDLVRTELRGANAARLKFSSGVELTLGPGTQLLCTSPSEVSLQSGEVQIQAPRQDQPIEFLLHDPQASAVRKFNTAGKTLLRVDRNLKLVEVKDTPPWLAGFEGASSNESLGSLLVKLPDGRNEPLTIGYHKVSVEIRDQIARTTIEESFVNRTHERLEGQFYFPLPADASISDFGMWIGNNLVEADIVEKQRAREIYETILREKRDPGLLEWTSGNLFKARVFPIESLSEKKIKIVYTQVLPLRGNQYRYSYGLQSELLQAHPLRELSISVQVNSALPLKSVTCPTQATRIQQTEHSAQVDFAAQEYAPERDFEVVCEVQNRNADVVVIPHRRGDDGYFLLQLMPPSRAGNWQRNVLPDGQPLQVVLLCDTSASMDSTKRKQQAEFVATVLSSLGEKDRFRLAVADVDTAWAGPEMAAPTAENIAHARDFLDRRTSLGWTNLEQAFAAVLKQAPAAAHVIYVGDGMPTAGDSDPASFVKTLGRLVAQTNAKSDSSTTGPPAHCTLHAVVVGNTYEPITMRGIAEVGHGTLRSISGDQTPQMVARQLLDEIVEPGLSDAKIEFHGLEVAAVYPDPNHLPQLPAGTQQILVGRYLPQADDLSSTDPAEVIVTGRLGNEPVRYSSKINLNTAEEGNSFIPRLWARQRLDYLLAQGQSTEIHDQIIALSEQFHIITPYTSLLVLESDADRERFGVKRSFAMRDGERFFAAGHDNADYELRQQQMKLASGWRLDLRRQVLRELGTLGRTPLAPNTTPLVYPDAVFWRRLNSDRKQLSEIDLGDNSSYQAEFPSVSQTMIARGELSDQSRFDSLIDQITSTVDAATWSSNDAEGKALDSSLTLEISQSQKLNGDVFAYQTLAPPQPALLGWETTEGRGELQGLDGRFGGGGFGGIGGGGGFGPMEMNGGKLFSANTFGGQNSFTESFEEAPTGSPMAGFDIGAETGLGPSLDGDVDFAGTAGESFDLPAAAGDSFAVHDLVLSGFDNGDFDFAKSPSAFGGIVRPSANTFYTTPGLSLGRRERGITPWMGSNFQPNGNYIGWLNTLFPALPGPPFKPAVLPQPENWSAEALTLAKSLLRTDSLQKTTGLELLRTLDTFDPLWNRRLAHHSDLELYSPNAWLTRPTDDDGQTLVNYCNDGERGVFSLATLLGRTRKSTPRDLATPPFALADGSLAPLDESHRNFTAQVEPAGENRALLVLSQKKSSVEYRLLIDTARHVLLKEETFDRKNADGQLTCTVTFSDFVEVAGSWWAQNIAMTDAKGRTTSKSTLVINQLDAADFRLRIGKELAANSEVAFLHLPFNALDVSRQHAADGSATLEDQITLMLYNCLLQQWDELFQHLDAAEKLTAAKPGIRWLRTVILATIGRREEARQRLLNEAQQLAAHPQPDDLYLADFLLGQAHAVTSAEELLQFVQLLKPVYDRQPADVQAPLRWQDRLAGSYDALDRHDEALALRRTLAEQSPWETGRQIQYAQLLMQHGEPQAAYDWLQKQLDRPVQRDESDKEMLRTAIAELYRTHCDWDGLLLYTTKWIAENPPYQSAYQQHLSALVFNNRFDDANQLAQQWLTDSQIDGDLKPELLAQLQAAVSFALGSGYGLSQDRIDPRWYEPLSQAALFFLHRKQQFDIAQQIINNYYISSTVAGDRLRGAILSQLEHSADQIPVDQIGSFVGWALNGRIQLVEPLDGRQQLDAAEVPDSVWSQIADTLHQRWAAAADADDKHQLGETLRTIFTTRFAEAQLLPFLRERIKSATPQYRSTYISNLFEALLSRPWTDAIEAEAFELLPQIGIDNANLPLAQREGQRSEAATNRLVQQVPALYRLVDAMPANRIAAAQKEFHDQGQVNQLTRTQLLQKNADFVQAAKKGVSQRLAEQAALPSADGKANDDEGQTNLLAPWFRIEQAYLDVQLDQHLPEVEEQCWKILGNTPPQSRQSTQPTQPNKTATPGTPDVSDLTVAEYVALYRQQVFQQILRKRAFVTAMNLATRRNATPASVDRLLKYIDSGIKQATSANVTGATAGLPSSAPVTAYWRSMKYRMLLALDRPDALEQQLHTWIQQDQAPSAWRQPLAMLLAERGHLDEAIRIFEALKKDQLLAASDYQMLADWYLATGRRDDYQAAKIDALKMLPEQYLARLLYGLHNRWYQTNPPLPHEIDEQTLLALRALFQKSANPENYFWQLRELYTACRDFRLLDMLSDAALGRSPEQIYRLLLGINGSLLNEVHGEATTDEILSHLHQLRDGKPTATDARALDLLEALTERHAAEVLDQPGPHVQACLAALKRAFSRQWGEGEPMLMANFLNSLGKLPHDELAEEQLREMRALVSLAPAGSRDHLHMTADLCFMLFRSYGKHDEALDLFEAEIHSYDQAQHGIWPQQEIDQLDGYLGLLDEARRYAAAEAVLNQYLAHPANAQQRQWLDDRRFALFNSALEHDGEVSLGKGDTLLVNLAAAELAQLNAADNEEVRFHLVQRLTEMFTVAHPHKLASTNRLLRQFVFQTIPGVLKLQQNEYQNTASAPLSIIREALGKRAALRYEVERLEQYPQRYQFTWNNGWQSFGADLARDRAEATAAHVDLQNLEPRVLRLAIGQLQRDLRADGSQNSNNSCIYHRGGSPNTNWFWAAKSDDFAQAAEQVLAEQKKSGRRAMGVAQYLWGGLGRENRAIEILLVAQRDGLLDEGAQNQLVDWLLSQQRWAEAIPILEALVHDHSDNMQDRAQLIVCYWHAQRPQQMRDLVDQTAAYFHEGGRWTEGNIAEFGKACLSAELYEKAVGFLNEAIALHQRANGQATINDAALSDLYQNLAQAQAGGGHTKDAVDAAAAAIVCWGPQQPQRSDALERLRHVLRNAKDLPAYIAELDAQVAKSGEDSPVLRKAIGQVLQQGNAYPQAIVQYQAAVALQANDKELFQALIACYDALQKPEEGNEQLLRLTSLDPHNLSLYEQLAKRLGDQPAEAERAITSIIEVGPTEAENHTALAEYRQQQNRWDEAIQQWTAVAQLRALEPTGLLKLAAAQLHQKQWDAAKTTFNKLRKTDWPARFGNVPNEVRNLEQQLPK